MEYYTETGRLKSTVDAADSKARLLNCFKSPIIPMKPLNLTIDTFGDVAGDAIRYACSLIAVTMVHGVPHYTVEIAHTPGTTEIKQIITLSDRFVKLGYWDSSCTRINGHLGVDIKRDYAGIKVGPQPEIYKTVGTHAFRMWKMNGVIPENLDRHIEYYMMNRCRALFVNDQLIYRGYFDRGYILKVYKDLKLDTLTVDQDTSPYQ